MELKLFLNGTRFGLLVICWIMDNNNNNKNSKRSTQANELYAAINSRLHALRARARRMRHVDVCNRGVGIVSED